MYERLEIQANDGRFGAYIAAANVAQAPVVVVLQEIFGINADMRQTCDWLAEQGFTAICPDLFWRSQPGIEMTDQSESEWRRGLELYKSYDFDRGVDDIGKAIAHARDLPGSSGKVGVIGYCLGGLMSFRAAVAHHPAAAVAYYGGSTEKYLTEAARLHSPLLMHLAGDDEYMPASAQKSIREALTGKSDVVVRTYAGCKHAFARHQGVHFDSEAAALANSRTLAFLDHHVR